jgi:hypothetical protein
LAAAALAGTARASVPITAMLTDASSSQAGEHADVVSRMGFDNASDIEPCDCHVLKELFINVPAGLVGTPTSLPQCTAAELSTGKCPVDSQVGVAVVHLQNTFSYGAVMPLYNMVPAPDQLALLSFPVPLSASNAVNESVTARTESDYGLEFHTFGIPRLLVTYGFTQVIWGVPGAHAHDRLRFALDAEKEGGCPTANDVLEPLMAEPTECGTGGAAVEADGGPVSFTNNPTYCSGPLTSSGETFGYDLEATQATTSFPEMLGCDQLSFDPSLSAKPTTTEADSPSGLDIDLKVPQTLSPNTPTPSAIKDVSVTLPEGFTVDANAADGKSACTAAEANFGTRLQAHCPEYSKIGTLGVESSSLPSILPGAMYLGEPLPGERYRVFMTFDGFSLHVKLAGTAHLEPSSGQVTVSFKELPQFNFQDFNMHIFGAEKGLLSTPTQCGTYPVDTTFTPWAYPSLPEQSSVQFFTIDSGPNGSPCPPKPRPFSPSMNAGVTDNTGGHHTTFVMDLKREDRDQNLAAVNVKTPPGFTATLAGIPYCPDATLEALALSSYLGQTELSSPACPRSKVGDAIASAGAGSKPVSLPGSVYLAGPYKGAPLSLAVVTPAVSGPYDLGNVVVRIALNVDETTAQITAVSDPIPQIVEGIPTRLRELVVELDREGFALNPTNCEPFAVQASAFGDEGAQADLENHFQVANCGVLGFAPKLSLRLRGASKRGRFPALTATLKMPSGDANISHAQVTLPDSELLAQGHIRTICTRTTFNAGSGHGAECPRRSIYGRAQAVSPLLSKPLEGPVYLRASSHNLPDLVAALSGQINIDLDGRVDAVRQRIRNTFEIVPDVPVSKFTLSIQGGKKGLLENNTDLCVGLHRGIARFAAQNGRLSVTRPAVHLSCDKRRRRARPPHLRRGKATVSRLRKAG